MARVVGREFSLELAQPVWVLEHFVLSGWQASSAKSATVSRTRNNERQFHPFYETRADNRGQVGEVHIDCACACACGHGVCVYVCVCVCGGEDRYYQVSKNTRPIPMY